MNKLTDTQTAKIKTVKSLSNFRLSLGQHRQSEFVAWVFMWMPGIAPLPNLFNLTYAIGHVLGGTPWTYTTAFLICFSIELMLIGVSEQLNGVIEKWLRAKDEDKQLYHIPLMISSIGSFLIVCIMLGLVYQYEVRHTGNYTALTLPFISILSVAFMGIRSYMIIIDNVKEDTAQYNDALLLVKNELELVQEERNTLTENLLLTQEKLTATQDATLAQGVNIQELTTSLAQKINTIDTLEMQINDLRNINNTLRNHQNELQEQLTQSNEQLAQINEVSEQLRKQSVNASVNSKQVAQQNTKERRKAVLNLLLQTNSNLDVNFSEWSIPLGATRQTISNDFKWLKNQGFWLNGDEWSITEKGQQFINV